MTTVTVPLRDTSVNRQVPEAAILAVGSDRERFHAPGSRCPERSGRPARLLAPLAGNLARGYTPRVITDLPGSHLSSRATA